MPGYIDYYKLADWWHATFNEEERAIVESVYAKEADHALTPDDLDFAAGQESAPRETVSLTRGEVAFADLSDVAFLNDLAMHLEKAGYDSLAARCREQATVIQADRDTTEKNNLTS